VNPDTFDIVQRAPTLICIAKDSEEVLGYLVVDSFVNGRSHGGVRMRQDVTPEEIGLLARTMTLKYGFLGLPFGGAKAGVLGNPEAPLEERRARLARFGRATADLLRKELFVPAADMGTDLEDIRHMLREAGVRIQKRRLPPASSGHFTAQSVFAALGEMVRFRGRELKGLKVAIEGFGKVGSALAGLLAQAGALVVAISTSDGGAYDPGGLDIPALQHMQVQAGSRLVRLVPEENQIDAQELPGLPVDALCPCANIHSIHGGNASSVRARVLCPGANTPWTLAAESQMEAGGALLLPDFAANSGGVLGTLMAYFCFAPAEIASLIQEEFARSTRWLLEQSEARGLPPRAVGEELITLRRTRQTQVGYRSPGTWLLGAGRALHRRGLVPSPVARSFARVYLRQKLHFPTEA
jgi:glutamate dehydrogenase/leucine dehydrogenase